MYASRLIAILLFFNTAVSAAAPPQEEPSSKSGVVGERIKKEADERLKPKPEEPVIQREPGPVEQPAVPAVQFVLKDVVLQGNTVLPTRVFVRLIDAYRNREVTVDDLQKLAGEIEQEYRRRGYVTTIAYLPPQRIAEGQVTIQIVEGRLGEISVEGNRYFKTSRILWYWLLKTGDVVRYRDIRKSLARMNDHPNRNVQALLLAGKAPGTTDVVLKVQDRLPLQLGSQWDRQGTPSIGLFRYGFSTGYNNLFGWDDRLVLGTVFGKDFGAVYTQYLVPVTPYGTTATSGFSHSQVSPQRQFKPFGINGISQTYSAGVDQSLVEEEGVSLGMRLGLEFKDSRTKVQSGTSRRDRLRVIQIGPHLRMTDAWGSWVAHNEYSFGIKGLGATSEDNPLAGRPGAPPDFFKVEFQLARLQRMPWQTQLIASLQTQLSPSKLLPQEELYLGGADTVRGYPEGDYLADQGVVARLEYVVPCRFLPAEWRLPHATVPLRDQLQLVSFLDRGYGRLRAITEEERTSRNLMGVGGGLRLSINQSFSARIEWGVNIGDRPLTSDSRSMLHFGIQYNG